MLISSQSAQQIVNEISIIVKQHVNMMDSEGYIIASTNPSRIGNFHDGAKRIISDNLDELYVSRESETSTMRAGLNLPIVNNNNTIGVIGITGEYDQVYNYGQIVKKMTEILVRESYIREQNNFSKKIKEHYIRNWIFGHRAEQGQSFIERGIALNIDITQPRRAMILKIYEYQQLAATRDGQKTIEKIDRELQNMICKDSSSVYLNISSKYICFISPRSDKKMLNLAEELMMLIKKNYDVDLMVGIDSGLDGTIIVNDAYEKANKALQACQMPSSHIMLYDKINMAIFINDIPRITKEEYLSKIFIGCSAADIKQWISILQAYFSCEGSITQAAEKLFMHKNTLQYKLNKLAELTGYDVRLPSSASIFYISILFYNSIF